MENDFRFNVDRTRFDLNVTFLKRLVGSDEQGSPMDFENVVNLFYLNPNYGNEVIAARKITDKKNLSEFKVHRPSMIPQCVVSGGASINHLVSYNNIMCLDVDCKDVQSCQNARGLVEVIFKKHALAIVCSISGTGLHIFVLIDEPQKREGYFDKTHVILRSCRIPVDSHFRSPVHKAVLAFDPDGFFNPDPVPFSGEFDDEVYKQIHEMIPRGSKSGEESKEVKKSAKQLSIPYILEEFDLRRNLLIQDVELNGNQVTDFDINSIVVNCVENNIHVDDRWVSTLIGSNKIKAYHPIDDFAFKYADRDYFGTIEKFCQSIKCLTGQNLDFPYFQTFFTKWWVKMFAQIYIPSVANELFLCLIGSPGIGKSHWLTNLLPEELRKYQAVLPMVKDKDYVIDLSSLILSVDDEFRARRIDDEQFFKSTLSLSSVRVRRPFDKKPSRLKRMATIAGNSNDPTILKDENRRVIPVQVESINWELANETDRVSLFLEGLHLFRSGYNYNLTAKETSVLAEISRDFEVASVEEEMVLMFFPKAPDVESAQEFISLSQILTHIKHYGGGVQLNAYKVRHVLERHKYPSKTISVHSRLTGSKDSRVKGWGVMAIKDVDGISSLFVARDMDRRNYYNL